MGDEKAEHEDVYFSDYSRYLRRMLWLQTGGKDCWDRSGRNDGKDCGWEGRLGERSVTDRRADAKSVLQSF